MTNDINAVENEEQIKLFKRVVEILEEQGFEASVNESYSGRCMYGETCVALVTDAGGVLVGGAIVAAYIELSVSEGHGCGWEGDYAEAIEAIPTRFDTMGRNGSVFY